MASFTERIRLIFDVDGSGAKRGFGSFALSHRPPRIGRNPKSGERVQVPEKRVPHFKPGKELRERVDVRARADGDER
jgi:hypothetical protein